MLSLVTSKGLFLNVGPKFILPVYSTFRQTIANDQISAYHPELNGKPVTNEVIMGKLTDAQRDLTGSINNEFKLAVAIGLEAGYEFKLKNGHSLDLGLYLDYSLYSMYQDQGNSSVISITTPPSVSGCAVVDVLPLTQAYATPYDEEESSYKVVWDSNGRPIVDYSLYNTRRLNPYAQLDIRIDKSFYFKKWTLSIYLDMENVTFSKIQHISAAVRY